MKKLLNISVIAALAVLPLAANAAVTDAVPGPTVTGDTATAATATTDPKYGLAQAHETDANLATAGYVKGAYNAAIKAINKVSEDASGAVKTVKVNGTALTATEGAVDVLVSEGTTNGSIKVNNTDIAVHGLGSAAYTASTDYISSAAGAVKTANIDDGQVTKEKLATAVQTSLDGAVQGVTLNGNALTETDGVVNVTAVQTVAKGTGNGTITVDGGADVTIYDDTALADRVTTAEGKITTLEGTVGDSNSGLVADVAALQNASGDYATKTGVLATINAATVRVMTTWGEATPTASTISVSAPTNFVNQ